MRYWARWVVVLGGLLTCVAGAAEKAPPPHDIALTISGGVSLGAYEAGLTWGTVRFLRLARAQPVEGPTFRPNLVGVTGASAGSINALLAAALWCEAPDSTADDSVDANLLRDAWLPVGLDDLLPENASVYRADDGLLSRRPLERVIAELRSKVFTPNEARRFQPGCSVPLGFSVTRLTPEVSHIEGLPAMTQRFVVPLALEVTPSGRVRLRHQPLPSQGELAPSALMLGEREDPEPPGYAVDSDQVSQAVLASAAFPVAFSPRDLCDCASSCPTEQRVSQGTCPGPEAGRPLSGLTCAARSTPGQELMLCRRPYVDGGVFDNAPVGLAIELVESRRGPSLWNPVSYVFVDPDFRRFQARVSSGATVQASSSASIAGSVGLFSGLVSTARNSELGRTARAMHWNRTTRSLLMSAAESGRRYAEVHSVLSSLAHGQVLEARLPEAPARGALSVPERLRRGRVLLSCVRRLSAQETGLENPGLLGRCAAALRGAPGEDPLLTDSPQAAKVTERLSVEELVSLGTSLSKLVDTRGQFRRYVDEPLAQAEEGERVQDAFSDGVELSSSVIEFFAGELDLLSRSEISETQQRELREAFLKTLRDSRGLSAATHLLANAVLDEQLRWIESMPEPRLSALAREARARLQELPKGALFEVEDTQPLLQAASEQLLQPEVAAAQREFEGQEHVGDLSLLAHRVKVIRALTGLVPRFQQLRASLEALSAQALALQLGRVPERRLFVTTRFAPLAGSQLGNFAGFLDRPLRELDYYAGVYDAVHTLSVQGCAAQDPYFTGRPAPARSPGSSDALELSDPQTQRCVGMMMRDNAEWMGVHASKRARHVLTALAREELAIALGSRARAKELLAEPAWAWTETASGLPEDDPLVAALEAARSHRRPCREGDTDALCLADPGFDEFLAGLRAHGFQGQERNMRLALQDPARWWGTTLRRAIDRATVLELQQQPIEGTTAAAAQRGVRLGLAAGQLLARREVSSGPLPRFEVDPSSLPAEPPPGSGAWKLRMMHLLPYRVAFDAANGGVAVAWLEPALRLSPRLSLLSKVEPLDFESAQDRLSSTVGLRPTVHLGGVSLGAGPRASLHWNGERRFDWGLELHGAVLQDRVGMSVGVRETPFSGRPLRSLSVSLSLADLNGLAYWLTL
ncbi:patatin-like phospholipase family protein [Hyalangium rubrum]|uniref:Patatin-like phospholipase family protein n=1 Tax=Hyalangium rubrum TaxID=3103134 RepID=A0ABU5HGZ4_9BACT|nr:patatin-like phospholipase family protein [Hyalangium sp. s54d21]MDY7232419.1 patatin-like phospholipase family protein [Hyalangium sp. s54d21]